MHCMLDVWLCQWACSNVDKQHTVQLSEKDFALIQKEVVFPAIPIVVRDLDLWLQITASNCSAKQDF